MHYQAISEKARVFVKDYMQAHADSRLLYHNLAHTELVVAAAAQVSRHQQLTNKEIFIINIAAWFCDIGYYKDVENHHIAAAGLAENFLQETAVEGEVINEIKKCILHSGSAERPASLTEKIIRDAGAFYLGTADFSTQSRLLRKETALIGGEALDKEAWLTHLVSKMESHQYYTPYCQQLLGKSKKQNLEKVKSKLREKPEEVKPVKTTAEDRLNKLLHEKEIAALRTEKGTETLFKISAGSSQRLSEQADHKANILISVNSIIMSILLSVVAARMERYPHLALPIILFLTVNLLTITFSILATRPSVPNGVFEQKDVEAKRVNLLFFGNFFRMNFTDYSSGMYKVLGDKNYMYHTFIKNHYEQGVVLGRKYRKLKMAYNIFMYGIIVSVVSFLISVFYFS